jgi:hypothetical protein
MSSKGPAPRTRARDVTNRYYSRVRPTILTPAATRAIVPALASTRNPNVWIYRFYDAGHDWTLSIATHAAPDSGKLSLGGFRIAPPERTNAPGFTTDHEAVALAIGMEEKIHWSRVIGVGGPLAMRDINRIVGGKCVLAPTPDARIGQRNDVALLDFAIACFRYIEMNAGFHLTTGQDLGHGLMRDGMTQSLDYLNTRYKGSVVADTSVPTGEGNYQLLNGMLRACEIATGDATVGLVGCGNIGMHIVARLHDQGTTMLALESRADRRAELEAMGIQTWAPESKRDFLRVPMDALVVNAAADSLDRPAVDACCANARLRVICGSENLAMPDASLALVLRDAHKIYAPTELGGMMGYLTAVEEYLSRLEGVPFDVQTLLAAASRLDLAGFEAATRIRHDGFRETFEGAVSAIFS